MHLDEPLLEGRDSAQQAIGLAGGEWKGGVARVVSLEKKREGFNLTQNERFMSRSALSPSSSSCGSGRRRGQRWMHIPLSTPMASKVSFSSLRTFPFNLLMFRDFLLSGAGEVGGG